MLGEFDITAASAIGGWMTHQELIFLALQAQKHQNILEIGCWEGRSTRAMLDHTSGNVTVVDTFKGTPSEHTNLLKDRPEGWLRRRFEENMATSPNRAQLTVIEADSASCPLTGRHFDMIFIDGDHSYEAVKRDVSLYSKLLTPDGLLLGHDGDRPEVEKAVRDVHPDVMFIKNTSFWVVGEV